MTHMDKAQQAEYVEAKFAELWSGVCEALDIDPESMNWLVLEARGHLVSASTRLMKAANQEKDA